MDVVFYDPRLGCAVQGALLLMPLPGGIVIDRSSRIVASTRLTRTYLTIDQHQRPRAGLDDDLEIFTTEGRHFLTGCYSLRADGSLDIETLQPQFRGTGVLYKDEAAGQALVAGGALTASWLQRGMLLIEGCALPLIDEDRQAVLIPPSSYYVGGRREAGYFHELPTNFLGRR